MTTPAPPAPTVAKSLDNWPSNAAISRHLHGTPAPSEVESLPEQWRCFHCDEVFQDVTEARLHFGRSERQSPACHIDIAEYRAMEQRMVSYNEEDADIHRQLYRMQNDHAQALLRKEEKGYARGLRDGPPYLAEREAEVGRLRDLIENALGCWTAAEIEGLHDRLAEDDEFALDRLKDLITRRLAFMPEYLRAALTQGETK